MKKMGFIILLVALIGLLNCGKSKEEGTPAAVAKIEEGELITRINSAEVFSVDDFENKINSARQTKADTVKVEIVRLGKTRVADLSLSD